jgi:hypothetical protein
VQLFAAGYHGGNDETTMRAHPKMSPTGVDQQQTGTTEAVAGGSDV